MRSRRPKLSQLALRRLTLLRERGITQDDLARRWKTSQSFVSQVLTGKARSEDREKDFAKLVGVPHERLFPPSPPKRRGDMDTLAAAASQ